MRACEWVWVCALRAGVCSKVSVFNSVIMPSRIHQIRYSLKVKESHKRSRWPKGFRVIKTLNFLNVRYYEGGSSSALRTGRLYPRKNPWYSFLGTESNPGHIVPPVAME